MKNRFFALAMLCATGYGASADDLPEYNKLRTPAAPAFTTLDVSPSQVERPNTPASLGAMILGGTHNLSSVPGNFALEFAPYWFSNHPYMTWRQDQDLSVAQSLARSFAVSIASAPITGTSSTALSLGLRANLFSGSLDSAKVLEVESQLSAASLSRAKFKQAAMQQITARMQSELGATSDNAAKSAITRKYAVMMMNASDSLDKVYDAQLQSSEQDIQSNLAGLSAYREGFLWDVASAFSIQARDSVLDSARIYRTGLWSTVSYSGTNLSAVAVGRWYGAPDSADVFRSITDFGARLIWAQDRFAFSGEAVYRGFSPVNGVSPVPQYRVGLIGEYKIFDNFWITGTLVKNYSSTPNRNIIAQFGLSYNHSAQGAQALAKLFGGGS